LNCRRWCRTLDYWQHRIDAFASRRLSACRFEGEEAGIVNGCGGDCGGAIDGGGGCDGHLRCHPPYPNDGILAIKS